ncbi:MAG: addiction module protein [Gammaproteobacteria bacterium]|nr:addiction module protein [Gammaproteobacteria bacterium]
MEPALLEQVLALPGEDRRLVADKIIGSFADEFEDDGESQAVVNAELRLRMASIKDGSAELVDYDDVKRASDEAADRFRDKQAKA